MKKGDIEKMKIGIIGAGYGGLNIAKELEKNGQEVTLFEKNRYVGGMVDTVSIYETRLEKYYRHIFKSDKEAISLIEEMGLKNELIWPATKMGYLSNRKRNSRKLVKKQNRRKSIFKNLGTIVAFKIWRKKI